MATYTKLSDTIIHSSLWCEPDDVRVLFITLLAMADRDGFVGAAIPGIAKAAGHQLEQTERNMERLQRPDPYSKNPRQDGRRVVAVEGGYQLVTYDEHREMGSEQERKAKAAARQRRKRDRDRAKAPPAPAPAPAPEPCTQADEAEELEQKRTGRVAPCPKCGQPTKLRKGSNGEFWSHGKAGDPITGCRMTYDPDDFVAHQQAKRPAKLCSRCGERQCLDGRDLCGPCSFEVSQ